MAQHLSKLELANEIALGYEYMHSVRERLNKQPDCNEAPLMPVDVRLELALRHLQSAVELLRRPDTEGISLAFRQVRSYR